MSVPLQAKKTSTLGLLKATVIGGLLFLLPLMLVVVLIGHALRLAGKVAKPVSEFLTLDRLVGPAGEIAFAVLLLVAISAAAGLVVRTRAGKRVMRWSENSMLGGLPQYQMVKSMAQGLAQVEQTEGISPALVNIEDAWQIGYVLEPLDNGWTAVFLPQSPTPMSGNIMYLPTERVRPLEMTMAQAMSVVKRMGIGSAKALQGTDLKLPA
jgi:uncharacterized membrane protein